MEGIDSTSSEGIFRITYLVVVTGAIIVGNVLVIVAVGKFKKLRKTTNIMLASLAVADLLVGVITVPLYIAWTMYPGVFDRSSFLCRSALLSSLLVVAASQINLIMLSVERYLAVCAPFKHRSLMIRCPWLHVVMIFLTWAISIITTGVASLAIKADYRVCNYYNTFHRWFLFFAVIFGVFIPFIAIIFMNIKVFLRVLKHEMRRKYFVGENSNSYGIRQVSDSSDEEIRVSVYKHDCVNVNKYDSAEAGCANLGSCLMNLKNKCTSSQETDNEAVLLNITRYTSHDHSGPSHYPSTDIIGLGLKHDVSNDSNSSVFIGNGYPDEYTDQGTVATKHEETGDVGLNEKYTLEWPLQRLRSLRVISQSTIDSKIENFHRAKSSRAINGNDIDYLGISPNHHNREECLLTVDHLSLLGLAETPKHNLKMSSIVSHNMPFHQKVYRTIETLATPRFLRKRKNEDSIRTAEYSNLSTNSSIPAQFLKNSDVNNTCIKENNENFHSTTIQNINTTTTNGESAEIELQVWEVEDLSLRVPLLPKVNNTNNTCSEQNADHSSSKDIDSSSVSNVDQKNNLPKSLQSDEHCKCTQNCLKTKVRRWLSENLLVDIKQDYLIEHRPSNSESKLTKHSTALIPTRVLSSPQAIPDNQRQPNLSTIPPNDETHPACPSSDLTIRQSLPNLQNVTLPQPKTPRRMTESAIKFHKARKVSTESTGLRRPRLVSLAQSVSYSRKMSSVRECGSTHTAYVSKKVARTVALVCFSFILAWLPFFSVIIMNTFCSNCDLVYFLNVVLMITFAQSASNPVIYALCHVSFRTAYKNLFTQMCQK